MKSLYKQQENKALIKDFLNQGFISLKLLNRNRVTYFMQ